MRTILMAALAAGLLPAAAGAHMTLHTDEAAAGSFWKAVVHMPHGCDGQATETIEATTADGLIAVKPMHKPSWTLTLTEGVRTVRPNGGRIADGVAPGTMLPIMAVQLCAPRKAPWDLLAAAGHVPHEFDDPAPLLRVAAAAGQDAHTAHAAQSGQAGQPPSSGQDALLGAGGEAGSAAHGDLVISGAVARASIGSAPNSALYMTITTAGAPDRLIAAASAAAQAVELHTSLAQGGVSKMQRVESIPVAPDAPAELAPGGYHIMLIGLAKPLENGATMRVTLTFEHAGEVTLDVPVSKDIAAHQH